MNARDGPRRLALVIRWSSTRAALMCRLPFGLLTELDGRVSGPVGFFVGPAIVSTSVI